MGTWLALLLATMKAVPAVRKWWEELTIAYYAYQDHQIEKATRDGIKKALESHDQRDLEKAMGSTKAGELSGNPNTTIRPSRPH